MPDGGVASNGHGGGRRVNRVHEAEAEPVQGTIRPAGRGRGFAHGGGGGGSGQVPGGDTGWPVERSGSPCPVRRGGGLVVREACRVRPGRRARRVGNVPPGSPGGGARQTESPAGACADGRCHWSGFRL